MCEHEQSPPIERAPRLAITEPLRWAIIAMVWVYRRTLGHFMGGRCRFQPSCSQYMLDAVERHGPVRGFFRGLARIARCHPWSEGGYDPA